MILIEGIDISDNNLHPLNAEFPIEVTEEGIDICVNEEHPSKAEFPISVTEEGIDIWSKDAHPLNNASGMYFISPIISSVLIPSKILFPNEFIEEGINI